MKSPKDVALLAAENAWKAACRRRDKEKCVLCDKSKENGFVIQIDHCFSRTASPLFLDPRNGTTLCSGCHFQKTYKQKAVDKIVDGYVRLREGEKWWAEAMQTATSKEIKKWNIQELEDLTKELNGMFLTTNMLIKKELEKSFKETESGYAWSEIEHIALWAARWMADKIAEFYSKDCPKDCVCNGSEVAKLSRKLAKELQ